ncbi:Adenosine monophosphate-protein transferase and cysteine protease IbpA precursor [Marinomonas spartinae]|uniref:Adenosine monophosphate-protein transferase and cysteine protease IbpA n=1 Tax=Marinomonas spartinae TaxID=1792290 RepID=A0A1A8TSB5_9GAMM|nr:hemagglutinin repeat-containing protein [Marinomonas spartinae]SBS36452.1 Adenosine monophosphate-protein transferase and cysteine protease IbpA precursor [Marinomonas spartinae]
MTNSGTLLAQNGGLIINTDTIDNQGTLAGHGITLNANSLNNSTTAGQIVSTDNADVTIAGDVTNTDGALVHADKDLTLHATGDLTNTASTIEAVNGLDEKSQNLTNKGTVLAQKGTLSIQTSSVDNQGTLAGNGIAITADSLNNHTKTAQLFSTGDLTLTIEKGITNATNALIHAANNLTLQTKGDLTNTAATIEAAGTNQITSQNTTNSGTLLAKSGALTIQTNKVDNQGTLAGNGIDLNANELKNSTANGQIISTDKADVTIAGDVSNTDGALIHADKDLTLHATGDLTNTASTIEAVNGLDVQSQNLTNTGTVLAQNGALTIHTNNVDSQGTLAGNGIAITADSLNNHSKTAQLFSTGDLTLTIEKGIENAKSALIHAAANLTLKSKEDLTNTTSTIEAVGTSVIHSQNVTNSGSILAQNGALTIETSTADNQGTLAGNGIALNANTLNNSTANGQIVSTDNADVTIAGDVSNTDGALIHADKDLTLHATGDLTNTASTIEAVNGLDEKSQNLTNTGTVLAQNGTLSIQTSSVDNQGTLAGNGIAITADSLNNHTKTAQLFSTGDLTLTIEKGITNATNALIHAANNLTLKSQGDLTNTAATIEAAGTNQITSQNMTNSGTLLAKSGALTIQTNKVDNQGTLAGNGITLNANSLNNSTANGQIVSTDKADVTIAGDVSNTDGALIHADKDLTLHATGDLTNTASTIEAVNELDEKSQNLTNTGTVLAQNGTLSIQTSSVDNQGTLAGNGIAITADSLNNHSKTAQLFSTGDLTLTIEKGIENAKSALIHAAANLTLKSKEDLTNTTSTIEAVGTSVIHSQNVTNSGSILAQNGALTIETSTADNQGTLAGNGIALNANTLNNSTANGQIVSTDNADVTIAGDVSNTDGALIHADKDLTLHATGDLTNTASTIEAVNGLDEKSQNLTNTGTVLAQNGTLSIQTSSVDNQGTLAGNGIAITADSLKNHSKTAQLFSTGDLTLTIEKGIENAENALIHAANNLMLQTQGDLTNTAATIEAAGTNQITSQNTTNSGTLLAKSGALTIQTNKVDNQGILAGNGIALNANTLNNSTANGQIVSTDKADVTIAGDVSNTDGALIHADKDLTLHATGDLTNIASTIEAVNGLDEKSQNLTNTGTVLAQNGALTIQISNVDNQGTLAGNGISITADSLKNHSKTAQLFSTGDLALTIEKGITNATNALIHAANNLTLQTQGDLTNTAATIEAAGTNQITSQNTTNSGTLLAKSGALTIQTNKVDNQGTLAGNGIALNANTLNNSTANGQIVSTDKADVTIAGDVSNTDGALIHADKDLTLHATGDLTNTASTIEAVNGLDEKSQNLTNTGTVLAQNGTLSIQTSSVDNQGTLAGNGIAITADSLKNHSKTAQLFSTEDLTLTIEKGITNATNALIHAANNLTLQTQGDLTNTAATIEAAGTNQITSQNMTNSGTLLAKSGALTIQTNKVDNQGTLAGNGIDLNANTLNNSTANGQIVSTDNADVTIASDVSNTDGALIHADKDLALNATGDLTNTTSTIEAINGLDVQSQKLTNSGTVLAQNGALTIKTHKVDSQGTLAGNGITLNANELKNSTANGQIVSTDNADVTIAGDVSNTDGALIHADKDLTLHATGDLTNTASTIEAVNGLDVQSQNLTNTGTVLAQNGALTIHTNNVDSQGTLAGNGIAITADSLNNHSKTAQLFSTGDLTLTIEKGITNATNALIHAANNLILNTQGDLTNTASTIETVGTSAIHSQNVTNSGSILAQNGMLTVNTRKVDSQGTLAGNGITIKADELNNSTTTGKIFSTDKADFTIAGDVTNRDGALIHTDKDLTLRATGDLTNTASTIESVSGLEVKSQELINTGTILAQNNALSVSTDQVDNQGVLAGHGITLTANELKNSTASGKLFSTDEANLTIAGNVTNTNGALIHADKDLTLNATGDLANASSAIEAVNELDEKSQNLINTGTVLAQNGTLSIQTSSVDNQGTLAGNGIAITADSLNNHTKTAQLFSTGNLTLTIEKGITNATNALIHAANNLILNTQGDLTNTASTIETVGTSAIHSQNVTNSGSILAQNGMLTVNTRKVDSQGTLAGNGITIKADELNNSTTTGKIFSTDKADFTIAGDVTNRDGALIHTDKDLTLRATGDLTNTASTIESVSGLEVKSQELINTGTILAQNNALSVSTDQVDNQGVLAGHGITLTANELKNSTASGKLFSTDEADLTIAGNVTNTDGALIHADKDLTLHATGDLTNIASTIEAVNGLDEKSQNLTNTGTVLAQNGTLSIQTSSVDNQGTLAGNGIAITADSLNNHSKTAQLFSTGDLTLTIEKGIENAENALIHAANNLILNTQADLTNTASTIEAAGTNQITSQNMTNSGTLLAKSGALTIQTNKVDNQGTLAGNGIALNANTLNNSTANGQIVSTDKADVTIAGDVSNTDGALIHADKDLTLHASGDLTNTASTIEAVNGLDVQSQNLTNSGTVLAQNGALTIHTNNVDSQGSLAGHGIAITATQLNNSTANGKIFSTDLANLTIAGDINNTGGSLIHADKALTLTSTKGNLLNTSATIESADQATINSQLLTNSGTVLAYRNGLTINANTINNQGLLAGHGVTIQTGLLNNTARASKLYSSDALNVNTTGAINNTHGALIHADTTLSLTAGGDVTNTDSSIESASNATVTSRNLDNSSASRVLAEKGTLTIHTNALNNQGTLSGQGLSATASVINNNTASSHILSTKDLTLTSTQGTVTNSNGAAIRSNGNLTIHSAADISNTSGDIEAVNNLSLAAHNITNTSNSTLRTNNSLLMNWTGGLVNSGSKIEALNNIMSTQNNGNVTNNSTGSITAQNGTLGLTIGSLSNQGGIAGNYVQLNTNSVSNDGSNALIMAKTNLDVRSNHDFNNTNGGAFYSFGSGYLQANGTLTNSSSTIETNGDLSIQANHIVNKRSSYQIGSKSGAPVNHSDVIWRSGNGYKTSDYTEQTTVPYLVSIGSVGSIISKGNINITGHVDNLFSLISSVKNINANGGVNNQSLTASKTMSKNGKTTTVTHYPEHCHTHVSHTEGSGSTVCHDAYDSVESTPFSNTSTEQVTLASAVFSAGASISAKGGSFNNIGAANSVSYLGLKNTEVSDLSNSDNKVVQEATISVEKNSANVEVQKNHSKLSNQTVDNHTQAALPVDVNYPSVSMSKVKESPSGTIDANHPLPTINQETSQVGQGVANNIQDISKSPGTVIAKGRDNTVPQVISIPSSGVDTSTLPAIGKVKESSNGTDDATPPLPMINQGASQVALSGQGVVNNVQDISKSSGTAMTKGRDSTIPQVISIPSSGVDTSTLPAIGKVKESSNGTDDATPPLPMINQGASQVALSGQGVVNNVQDISKSSGTAMTKGRDSTIPQVISIPSSGVDTSTLPAIGKVKESSNGTDDATPPLPMINQGASQVALSGQGVVNNVQDISKSSGTAMTKGRDSTIPQVISIPSSGVDTSTLPAIGKVKESSNGTDDATPPLPMINQGASQVALSGQTVATKVQNSTDSDGKGETAPTGNAMPNIATIDHPVLLMSNKEAADQNAVNQAKVPTSEAGEPKQQPVTVKQGASDIALSEQSDIAKAHESSPSDQNQETVESPSVSVKGMNSSAQSTIAKVKEQVNSSLSSSNLPNLGVKQANADSKATFSKAAAVATHAIDLSVIKSRRDKIFNKDIVSKLESSALFQSNNAPDPAYLVETNPLLTNYKNFVSSDYFLNKVSADPVGRTGKKVTRLGDGYLEQKLVRDQILAFTGQQTLDNTDIESAYKTLMDNAVGVYKNLGLTSGVELTADQVAQLKKPIVWMVDETVQTDNGPQVVLVPKVYLSAASEFDLRPDGAVVAASTIHIDSDGDINNAGSMLAKVDLSLKGNNIDNAGVLSSEGSARLTASNYINNTNRIHASSDLSLTAGGNITSETLTKADKLDLGYYVEGTTAEQTASIQGGNVTLAAGKDIRLTGSDIKSTGGLALTAGNNIALNSIALTSSYPVFNDVLSSYQHQSTTAHQVTKLSGQNIQLSAGNVLTGEGAQINAKEDLVLAANNINLLSVQNHQSSQQSQPQLTASNSSTTHQVSQLSGNNIQLSAANTITSEGAQINAREDLGLSANAINLLSVQDSQSGYQSKPQLTATNSSTTHQVTKLSGNNIQLSAANTITSEGAQINAKGDLALAANNINLLSVQNHQSSQQSQPQLTASHSSTTHQVTKLSGNNIQLSAANTITSEGAQINAKGGLALAANNIDLLAVKNINDDYSYVGGGHHSVETKDHTESLTGTTLKAGGGLNLTAQQDIFSKGSSLSGGTGIALAAGNNVTLATASTHDSHFREEKSKHSGFFGSKTKTETTTSESLTNHGTALSSNGAIQIASGANIQLIGSSANAKGNIGLQAKGNIDLLSAVDQNAYHHQEQKKGTFRQKAKDQGFNRQTAVASGLTSQGNVALNSGGNITLQGANLVAKHTLSMGAQAVTKDASGHYVTADGAQVGNVNITTQTLHNNSWDKSSSGFRGIFKDIAKGLVATVGAMGISTSVTLGHVSEDTTHITTQQASNLAANTLHLKADHDLNIIGSNVSAAGDATLSAANVRIDAAKEQSITSHAKTDMTFSTAGPSLKKDELSLLTLTDTDKTNKTTTTATTWSGSNLKAGNLTINAKGQAAVIASNVNVDGNAAIQSNNLLVGGREATTTTQHDDITKTKTFTAGIRNAYVDTALAAQNLKKSKDAVSDAQQAYRDAKQKVANGTMVKEDLDFYEHKLASAKKNEKLAAIAVTSAAVTAAMSSAVGGFTATAGTSTQVTTNTSTATQGTWQGSHIKVGNNASLHSDNNLTVEGSTIAANGTLEANAKNIDIKAGKNTYTETTSSQTKGASASISYGGGSSGSAGINASQGHSESNRTHYTNSALNAGKLVSNSDQLTVKGGNLYGDQVAINTNHLKVTSLQDSATSHSKNQGAGISVGAGSGSRSASVNYNQSKTQSDYASVTQQSGITSGDQGYQIHVAGNTQLVGGLVTSTDTAEANGKNAFSTGTLTHKDIANHATYSGSSIGVEVGISSDKDKDGNTTHGVSKSIGRGSDGDSQHSVTHSGINTGNIAINDTDKQKELTGDSVSQTVAGINTTTSTDTAQANSGALKNNFDQAEVEKNINHQRSVTQTFDNTVQQVSGALLAKQDALKEKFKNGKISSAEYEKQSNTLNNYKLLVSSIGAGLLAPTDSATGQWAAAASPVVANQIGQYFKGLAANNKDGQLTNGQEVAHDLAHGIVAAAVASAGGNNAVTTGIAAAGSEAAAPAVAKWLYGTSDPNKLDANQKQTIIAVIGAAATGVGATTGNTNNAIAAGQAGENAVANNYLSSAEMTSLKEKLTKCSDEQCREKAYKDSVELSKENLQGLINACSKNGTSQTCLAKKKEITDVIADYRRGKFDTDGSSPEIDKMLQSMDEYNLSDKAVGPSLVAEQTAREAALSYGASPKQAKEVASIAAAAATIILGKKGKAVVSSGVKGEAKAGAETGHLAALDKPKSASKVPEMQGGSAQSALEGKASNGRITSESVVTKTGGRSGKQARLKELGDDPKLGEADRGWIKQEKNSIARGNRKTIRNPPGKDLAHERGREAAKGYGYEHSNLQDRKLHRLQHKYDNFGRKNKERPPR